MNISPRLLQLSAIAGIAFPFLATIAQLLMEVGGMEPPFSTSQSEIVAFFASRDITLFSLGSYLTVLTLIPFLWFLGGLWEILRKAEGESGWLSVVALASGLLSAMPYTDSGGWFLAVYRINEGLDPQLARTLFDQGNLTFANSWVASGSLVLAVGMIALRSTHFPRWLGWGSLLLAPALFAARAAWTTTIAFIPIICFWLWIIAIGVIMLRQSRRSASV